MIQRQLKLKLTKKQEAALTEWLPTLTSIWNWSVRKIELDARDGFYHTPNAFQNMLPNVSRKLGVPSHTIQGMLSLAHQSWSRCFNKLAKKPRLKGQRNRLNSIPFPDPIKSPVNNMVRIPGIGAVRYHKQDCPAGKIKCGRIVKRASGWYFCLFIDTAPAAIPRMGNGRIGIDPGYAHLITISTGEKIQHPKELQQSIQRLGQAQKGINRKQVARFNEHIANQRKDRNHKLSRWLVSENNYIAFSKDNLRGLSRCGFGKSVASAAHGQLRSMLTYKCRTGNMEYVEVPSKGSTRICSQCGDHTGPQGRAELPVREWVCSTCGTLHDRDVNAAINTLIAAVGMTVERAN